VATGYASGRIWAEVRKPGAACLVTTCGRIEISDRQNREGQHPLSAGPRAGYRRDWLIVWPLESARAHGGLTELGNADLPDTQIRALRGFDLSASTFGKTMPFFGNILPTLRSYSGIEYPPGQRLRLHFAFAAERPGSGLRADAATSRVLTRGRRQGRRAAGGGRRRGRAVGAVNPINRCAQVVIKPKEVAKFQKKYVSLIALARCAR